MRSRLAGLAPSLLLLSASCAAEAPPVDPPPRVDARAPIIPAAKDVVEVRFIPNKNYPPGRWPDATLTKPKEIGKVIEWLRGIDWSREPGDITRMDLPPLSQLKLTKRDQTVLVFMIHEGAIIADRWRWLADTDRLKAILKGDGG